MILRRLGGHAANYNWFAAGIDILVLMVGIFLGLQANNWNQAQIDRHRGHEYRRRLVDEIRADERQLVNRRHYFIAVRRHAKQALTALDRPASSTDSAFLVDAYQASQITPTRPARAAYDEIVSTGNVETLGNFALREQVANYYIVQASTAEILDFVPPYRERLRETMPSSAQEAIRTQCAEIWHLSENGLYSLELPRRCALRLDRSQVARSIAAVRASTNVTTDLTRLIADLDGKITVVDALLTQARQIESSIVASDN